MLQMEKTAEKATEETLKLAQANLALLQLDVAKLEEKLFEAKAAASIASDGVDQLQTSLTTMKKSIASKAAIVHPVRQLSSELLEEIFYLHQIASSSFPNSLDTFAVTGVCRHWRGVAINAPHLWRNIPLSLSGKSGTGSFLQMLLHRARMSKIHLKLGDVEIMHSTDTQPGTPGIKRLKLIMERAKILDGAITEVSISVDGGNHLNDLKEMDYTFASATSLHIIFNYAGTRSLSTEVLRFFPSITEIDLRDVFLSLDSTIAQPIEKLTYIGVERIPPSTFVTSVIRYIPTIKTLKVEGASDSDSVDEETVEDTYTNDTITHLDINFIDVLDCMAPLRNTELPNLESITFGYFPAPEMKASYETFFAKHDKNTNLKTLVLDFGRLCNLGSGDDSKEAVKTQVALLRHLPSIEVLEVRRDKGTKDMSKTLWEELKNAIAKDAPAEVILPALKEVKLVNCKALSMDVITEMVEGRRSNWRVAPDKFSRIEKVVMRGCESLKSEQAAKLREALKEEAVKREEEPEVKEEEVKAQEPAQEEEEAKE